MQRFYLTAGLVLLGLGLMLPAAAQAAKTVTANVVILDHVLVFNRLGAQNVNGMIYALERDLVNASTLVPCGDGSTAGAGTCEPGETILRPDKRPRPIVLRVSAGDTLVVNFTNLLTSAANPDPPLPDEANPCVGCVGGNPLEALDNQVAGRKASFHVQGMQLDSSIADDGSFVGKNASSLAVKNGGSKTYTYLAEKEGTFLVTSMGATFGGEATGGNVGVGAMGSVNVQPAGASYYRSQVTEEELRLAADCDGDGLLELDPAGDGSLPAEITPDGHPVLAFPGTADCGYDAIYPAKEADTITDTVWVAEGKAGKPILNMLASGDVIFHADINAIITGTDPSKDGHFLPQTYPLEDDGQRNPTVPNRLEPYREFTIIFHDEQAAANAFPAWFDENAAIGHTTHGVRDSFMINYGSGGIGSEIIANRLGVGPMWDCLNCAYEEFFLTSFAVGDPAMLVDEPANTGLENCGPAGGADCADVGPKATKAFYPDDPSNVHHTYTGDFTKIRNLHAGPKEQHIFHLHNHQWLFNANDDNANYLDAQGIGPGSGYTYEINFGGSGNRNKTAGDAIFHCHFYPHFAQGMWALWRNHDTTEVGTELAVSGGGIHTAPFALKDGTPAEVSPGVRTRALPDGEIIAGTPIPAVVPLPGKPMAPMPGTVTIVNKNTNPGVDDIPSTPALDELPEASQANVIDRTKNPGYPFWIAGVDCGGATGLADPTGCRDGIVGQRPTTPPLDMLTKSDAADLKNTGNLLFQHPGFEAAAGGFDGGLPRHALEGFRAVETTLGTGRTDINIVEQNQTRFDFRKVLHKAKPVYFPEAGTDLEQVAMDYHAQLNHSTFFPDGTGASFRTNGALPVPGAPFQEPCIDDQGTLFESTTKNAKFFGSPGFFNYSNPDHGANNPRVYKAANIQLDAVFNKVGYHFPQQRILSLWGDVMPLVNNQQPPEPLVMRMNTFDCTQYYHSNLVPAEYELDDYQVRTPTDIIGQHIHLPKWDLTSADGAGNGWNYEDGTLSPQAVIERINAINSFTGAVSGDLDFLAAAINPDTDFPDAHALALGARTTIQRWFADPVVNTDEEDRGLGVVFTHDHYGPSTHQQVGLYATVLTEPASSTWKHNETGDLLATRSDGGPTSWQAIITPPAGGGNGRPASDEAFREFYLEFGDFQHAYEAGADGILDVADPDQLAFRKAINPSVRQEALNNEIFPDILRFPPFCPGGVPRPCPEAISADDVGMLVVNYRNEPVGLRVFDPDELGPDGRPGTQAIAKDVGDGTLDPVTGLPVGLPDAIIDAGEAVRGDLAYALASVVRDPGNADGGGIPIPRAIPEMNLSPEQLNFWTDAALNPATLNAPGAVRGGDPFTPMLRTYPGDRVRIKIQAGATEHEHMASIHGVKWLQGGSGYGEAPNSGWRNAQGDGISEQFTFNAPLDADVQRVTGHADYAYSVDASQDGWWSGLWGIMRNYQGLQADLEPLPDGFTVAPRILNDDEFAGVCPAEEPNNNSNLRVPANLREYTVIAMTAQELLDNSLNATLVPNDASATMHEGAPVDPNGGTLVYNPRGGDGQSSAAQFKGPLHDPTALLFVNADDLEPVPGQGNECQDGGGPNPRPGVANPTCEVQLKAGVKPEPLVLRAAAGDCVEVTLFSRLPEVVPDLAGYNTLLQIVNRRIDNQGGLVTFQNNLIRPSSRVGLHAQMVEYDVTQHDGACVGVNACNNGRNTVGPVNPDGTLDKSVTYRWYAGNLDFKLRRNGVDIVATPVEFGSINLIPADKIKQGQKALVGALIVEPEASTWTEDAGQHAAATVDPGTPTIASDDFRDFAVVFQKGLNLRYGTDGTAVENIAGEGGAIPEDSHDAGQKAINYGTEPAWYRFGLRASTPFGGGVNELGAVADAHLLYSNTLVNADVDLGDPATPVFNAIAGEETRMRLLQPTGVGRGSTFDLHGHLWQRDPYLGGAVSSQTIGTNPIGFYLGGQESVQPSGHFDIRLPSAGGANLVAGDYLFRDHGSFGNTDGLWGIMRVAAALPAPNTPPVVTITAPADGSSFQEGDLITFTATAIDTEDGVISANIGWNSSIDGNLGTGASVPTNTLSTGTHTITASVTDSGGLPGSDSITVIVTVGGADTITITRATFRQRQVRWNVQGTGTVPGALITVTHDQSGVQVGSATVDTNGDWQINPGDPAAFAVDPATITAVSSNVGTVLNFPVNVRR